MEQKYRIRTWLKPNVTKKLQKAAEVLPEYNVNIKEVEWHDDGDLVYTELNFRNCGRNEFYQRIVQFMVRALDCNNDWKSKVETT